jgi:hypothetical protein
VPVIVTTAKLYLLEFDARDVNAESGTIEAEKVQLAEKNCLVFESPLSRHLQRGPGRFVRPPDELEAVVKFQSIVVQSRFFSRFLEILAASQHQLFNGEAISNYHSALYRE